MTEKFKNLWQKILAFMGKLNQKHKSIIVIVELLVACVLIGSVFWLFSMRNWNAAKIVRELTEAKSGLTTAEVQTEDDKLTEFDAVLSSAYFQDDLIKTSDLHPFAGCVEVLANHQDALLRKTYLETLYQKINNEINVSDFGKQLTSQYAPGKPYLYVNGNVLLRLDSQYSNYESEQIIKSFNHVLEKDEQTEKNILEADKIEEIQKKNEERAVQNAAEYKSAVLAQLESQLAELEKQAETTDIDVLLKVIEQTAPYQSVPVISERAVSLANLADGKIQAYSQEIEDGLAYANETLVQEDLDNVKTKIAALKHPIFDEYKDDWDQQVTDIQWAINDRIIREYKAQCEVYEYDDIISDIDSYTGSYAYFRGKIVEVTETSTGTALRVNITPVYSYFTDTILYWEDSIYVDLAADSGEVVEKDDLIEMWGVIDGTTTHSTLFGGDQTVLKFSCRYAAKNG